MTKRDRLWIVAAFVAGALCLLLLQTFSGKGQPRDAPNERQPLYWVAPMDDNYRRDKPGKSPMGMDLVPVYAEDERAASPGVVRISPSVVQNLGVRMAPVIHQALQVELDTVGYVQFDEGQLVHVHPRVEGWVERLYVNAEGDPVSKGQTLYEIYSPSLVNAQEELVLALRRENAALIDAAKSRLKALQLPAIAIDELIKTRRVRQTIAFKATHTGVIHNLKIRQGFYVQPGTTLMSIGALERVWIEAEIFESQLPFVNLGTPVRMTVDYLPGQRWEGRVDYIYPALDVTTRTARFRVVVDNTEGQLKPNMFAQVKIQAAMKKKSLLVPTESIIRTGHQNRVVLALGGGQFKSVAVQVGLQDKRYTEVLHGVAEGENVVSSAQFLIDSESSKTSDFNRMAPWSASDKHQAAIQTAEVKGKIIGIDGEEGIVTIHRQAIEKWGRAPATVDFTIEKGLSLTQYKPGDSIRFRFEIRGARFYIVAIEKLSLESAQSEPLQLAPPQQGREGEQ